MSTYAKKPFETKPDTGNLFAEPVKKGPQSPDYSGTIAINLKDLTAIKTENGLTVVKLSGWKKVGKDGKTYLSISVDRFLPKQEGETYSRQPIRQEDDFGDQDIPF